MTENSYEGWALIELMGHRQRVGRVREVDQFGAKLLRIDIPTDTGDVTEFYGGTALYAVRPYSEDVARQLLKNMSDPRPVMPAGYQLPKPEEEKGPELPFRYSRAVQPQTDDDDERPF